MPWFLALSILGFANGLRTVTPIAVLCWFAYTGHLDLKGTWAVWETNLISAVIFTILAIGEYIGDKLPKTPNRIAPGPLMARIGFAGLVGSVVVTSLHKPLLGGFLIGAVAAVAGAFLGFHVRRYLTVDRGLPDFPIALAEDVVTISLSVLAFSQLSS